MTKKHSSFKEHQLITENFRAFLAEQEDQEQGTRMTSADYQKSVRDDRGQAGSQTGVDDVERKALALVQQKVAQAAAAGDIKTGMPARLIKALVKELDKILAKKK
jgi:hypothetical protein